MNIVKTRSRNILVIIILLAAIAGLVFRLELSAVLRDGLVVADQPEHADAIYILAGTPDLEARTQMAADLYHRGLAPFIFYIKDNSQGPWEPAFDKNLTYAERSRVILERYAVPEDAIVVLTADRTWAAKGTYEEAMASRKFIQEKAIRSLILVTSPLHTRRARQTFRRILNDLSVHVLVVPATPEALDGQEVFSQKTGLKPLPEGMIRYEGLKNIALEYVKTGYYAVRLGWRRLLGGRPEVREPPSP